MASWIHHLFAESLVHGQSPTTQLQTAIYPARMVNLVGLLSLITQHLPARIGVALVAVASLTTIVACFYLIGVVSDERAAFSIAILCAMLVSYHMYVADATLLLLRMNLLSNDLPKPLFHATYIIPPVVLFGLGANWTFLLAIPVLWMLHAVSRSIRAGSNLWWCGRSRCGGRKPELACALSYAGGEMRQ